MAIICFVFVLVVFFHLLHFRSILVSEQLRTLPLPYLIISPDLLSVDCYWAKGGVGAQLLKY